MISDKEQIRLREKYNPEDSVLRRAQLRMLDMLAFLDSVCEKYNLTYWLDSGTLLGAARHGGFIPWDDDVDVCMPYEDVVKLFEVLKLPENSSDYVLQCKETDPNFMGAWNVLRDKKTECIQDSKLHQKRKYRGLQIDIFGLVDNSIDWVYDFFSNYHRRLIDEPLKEKNIYKILLPLVGVNYKLLHDFMIPFVERLTKFKKNDYYRFKYPGSSIYKRYKSDIYPLTRMPFEGKYLRVPHNYGSYLSRIYGKWETLPDEKNIITHELQIIFKDAN